MQVFGIGGGEFVVLVVLAVIMFGPDKLPGLARRAARVVHFVRIFANQATDQLKQELGPEYKDLKPADLNPKTLVSKLLLADVEDDINDIRRELNGVKADLTGSVLAMDDAAGAAASAVADPAGRPSGSAADPVAVAWDPEAT